jgi:hypothetical protein
MQTPRSVFPYWAGLLYWDVSAGNEGLIPLASQNDRISADASTPPTSQRRRDRQARASLSNRRNDPVDLEQGGGNCLHLVGMRGEHGGDRMVAHIAVMRALHRHKPKPAPRSKAPKVYRMLG